MASRRVAEECNTLCAKRDVLQLYTCGGGAVGLDLRVLLLVSGHGSVDYPHLNGVNGGSRQSVSYQIALAFNMPDVCCEFRDVGKLALLST